MRHTQKLRPSYVADERQERRGRETGQAFGARGQTMPGMRMIFDQLIMVSLIMMIVLIMENEGRMHSMQSQTGTLSRYKSSQLIVTNDKSTLCLE